MLYELVVIVLLLHGAIQVNIIAVVLSKLVTKFLGAPVNGICALILTGNEEIYEKCNGTIEKE
jgi:hypothetical protein